MHHKEKITLKHHQPKTHERDDDKNQTEGEP